MVVLQLAMEANELTLDSTRTSELATMEVCVAATTECEVVVSMEATEGQCVLAITPALETSVALREMVASQCPQVMVVTVATINSKSVSFLPKGGTMMKPSDCFIGVPGRTLV